MRDTVLISKDRWVRKVASRVHKTSFFPKEAWKAMKILRDGHNAHHVDNKPITFRMENGVMTTTENNVADGVARHFKDVCNRNVSVDWDFIANVPKKLF